MTTTEEILNGIRLESKNKLKHRKYRQKPKEGTNKESGDLLTCTFRKWGS